jgi:hypothetical protein
MLEGKVEHVAGTQGHRGLGHVRKLPSKRFQASYLGPDGLRHLAGETFTTKLDAEGWLAAERDGPQHG